MRDSDFCLIDHVLRDDADEKDIHPSICKNLIRRE